MAVASGGGVGVEVELGAGVLGPGVAEGVGGVGLGGIGLMLGVDVGRLFQSWTCMAAIPAQ